MDWPGLMRAGLGGLGLTPEVFWRLTPLELKIMLGVDKALPALTRARLDELAAAFPDIRKGRDDGGDRGSAGPDRGAGGDTGGGVERGFDV
ncbi:MAG: rcc01693 family protein [Paracoccaceae bacterium]